VRDTLVAMVTLGFSVHTGWAAMVAADDGAAVVERRTIEMIAGHDPEAPPFVYHAARALPLARAERLVRDAAEQSCAKAKAALAALALGKIARAAIVVGDRPAPARTLEQILASHAAIHTAEGALFRAAIADACAARKIAVVEVRAGELRARAAERLEIAVAGLDERLAAIGRAAGRPWAKDQKVAFLAALVAAG
jgi:hypothetical protein